MSDSGNVVQPTLTHRAMPFAKQQLGHRDGLIAPADCFLLPLLQISKLFRIFSMF